MKKKYQVNLAKFSNRNLLEERYIIKEKNRILKKVDTVNTLLKALKKSDYYDVSGAVEKLKDYTDNDVLNLINQRGLISKKSIKNVRLNINLTAIDKAIEDFKLNIQSTVSYMKTIYDERVKELAMFTDNEEWANTLSKRQIKNIYKMFDSEQYEKINSQLSSTEIFTPYVTAISEQWTQEKFVDTILRNSNNLNDVELRNNLKQLYTSSIKGKIQYAKKKNI